MAELHPRAQQFQEILKSNGFSNQVIQMPESTHSALAAANAIQCDVAQIVKSLIFRGKRTGSPILVLASGRNRVDVKKLKALIGEKPSKADADFVRKHTGFAIGGVPPFGHVSQMQTFLDEDLLQYAELWAAAGTPFALFKLTPDELQTMTQGTITNIRED